MSKNLLAALNTPKISRKQSIPAPNSRQYLESILVQLIDVEENETEHHDATSPGPLVIKDRYHRLRKYKSVFSGKNLLEKLVENQITGDVDGAIQMAELMVEKKIITRVLNAPISKRHGSSSKRNYSNGDQNGISHNGINNKIIGWTDKDLFRLGDDVGVNLKKVVRSMLSLKARVKHLEGALFDLRETLLELEADIHYEKGIFSNFIHVQYKSQIFLVLILLCIAAFSFANYGIAFEAICFCFFAYLTVWWQAHSKFIRGSSEGGYQSHNSRSKPATSLMNTIQQQIPLYGTNTAKSDSKTQNGKPRKSFLEMEEQRTKRKLALSRSIIEAREASGINQTFLAPYPGTGDKKQTCWIEPPGGDFLVRGSNYLVDSVKVPSKHIALETLTCELASMEKNVKVETMAGLSGSTADYLSNNATIINGVKKDVQLFVVTFLVPGYVVSWTCQVREDMEPDPAFDELWEEFYNSPDDNYRNERLKILPNIPDGNWIVKKTVGKKPAIAARAVDAQWNRGNNYLEVVYDVSTSYVGNKIFSVVKGYAKKITLDLAFVIQGNTRRELPERVLCATRFFSIDLDDVNALEM
eukprot:g2215.t1